MLDCSTRSIVVARTRSVFIGVFIGTKMGNFFFRGSLKSHSEAQPVPDEERGSSAILDAGVLGVPRENSGLLS